jgi:hypothetical protein
LADPDTKSAASLPAAYLSWLRLHEVDLSPARFMIASASASTPQQKTSGRSISPTERGTAKHVPSINEIIAQPLHRGRFFSQLPLRHPELNSQDDPHRQLRWYIAPAAFEAVDFQNAMLKKYGNDVNLSEAARHIFWQAFLTRRHGIAVARAAAEYHEKHSPPGQAIDSVRDRMNNEVGQRLGGLRGAASTFVSDQLWQEAERAILQGRGFGINSSDMVVPLIPDLGAQ